MLTLARLNATAVSSRSVDVHALVADVVAETLLHLPADAMEFTVTPAHIVRWRCDAASLQIALSAVIDNGVRHARDGGHIDIAIVRGADRLVVTVGTGATAFLLRSANACSAASSAALRHFPAAALGCRSR